mmetsp:Transcript_19296/g.28740  ORF Transcript_19296/g.28740 Transcript_19296/m.28740 type:complete len:200 (-) Transcript_19296:463-1062(-)
MLSMVSTVKQLNTMIFPFYLKKLIGHTRFGHNKQVPILFHIRKPMCFKRTTNFFKSKMVLLMQVSNYLNKADSTSQFLRLKPNSNKTHQTLQMCGDGWVQPMLRMTKTSWPYNVLKKPLLPMMKILKHCLILVCHTPTSCFMMKHSNTLNSGWPNIHHMQLFLPSMRLVRLRRPPNRPIQDRFTPNINALWQCLKMQQK